MKSSSLWRPMDMQRSKSLIFSGLAYPVLCLTLGGCATTAVQTHGPIASAGFGDAVRHNIELQAVPPTDAQKQDRTIPADPDRRKLALENYKNNEVPDPVAVQTAGGSSGQ